MPRTGFKLMFAVMAGASIVLQAGPDQGREQGAAPGPAQQQGAAQAQGRGRGPQPPGQASDEDNKNIPDGVKADQAGFVAIFDGKSMTGWNLNAKSGHSATSGKKSAGRREI